MVRHLKSSVDGIAVLWSIADLGPRWRLHFASQGRQKFFRRLVSAGCIRECALIRSILQAQSMSLIHYLRTNTNTQHHNTNLFELPEEPCECAIYPWPEYTVPSGERT